MKPQIIMTTMTALKARRMYEPLLGGYRVEFYRVRFKSRLYPAFQLQRNIEQIMNMFPDRIMPPTLWDFHTMVFSSEEDALLCYMKFA